MSSERKPDVEILHDDFSECDLSYDDIEEGVNM